MANAAFLLALLALFATAMTPTLAGRHHQQASSRVTEHDAPAAVEAPKPPSGRVSFSMSLPGRLPKPGPLKPNKRPRPPFQAPSARPRPFPAFHAPWSSVSGRWPLGMQGSNVNPDAQDSMDTSAEAEFTDVPRPPLQPQSQFPLPPPSEVNQVINQALSDHTEELLNSEDPSVLESHSRFKQGLTAEVKSLRKRVLALNWKFYEIFVDSSLMEQGSQAENEMALEAHAKLTGAGIALKHLSEVEGELQKAEAAFRHANAEVTRAMETKMELEAIEVTSENESRMRVELMGARARIQRRRDRLPAALDAMKAARKELQAAEDAAAKELAEINFAGPSGKGFAEVLDLPENWEVSPDLFPLGPRDQLNSAEMAVNLVSHHKTELNQAQTDLQQINAELSRALLNMMELQSVEVADNEERKQREISALQQVAQDIGDRAADAKDRVQARKRRFLVAMKNAEMQLARANVFILGAFSPLMFDVPSK